MRWSSTGRFSRARSTMVGWLPSSHSSAAVGTEWALLDTIRLGKRTEHRSPLIKEFVPLAEETGLDVVDEEPLLVDVWCSTVGAARIIMEYAAHHRGTKVARALTELCPFDFVAGRLRRMYSQEKSAMLAMSAPATSWPALPVVDVVGRTDPNDVVTVPIRWSDVDRYGHVNNVSLAGYLQEARILATTAWSPATRSPSTT